MNKNIAVLVIMCHPSEDARIIKHWEYVYSNYQECGLIHFLLNKKSVTENVPRGWCIVKDLSLIGSIRRRLHLYWKNKNYITDALKMIEAWEANYLIVHVHDACLLPIAVGIKKYSKKPIKIIYDKHENGRLLTMHLSVLEILFNEWYTSHHIDGIVLVSESMEPVISNIWGPKIPHVLIPNYPKGSWRDLTKINNKQCNDCSTSAVYFGSLGEDRDFALVCVVAKQLLMALPQLKIIIGGRNAATHTMELLREMQQMFPERFVFLGEVPYSEVIEQTQCARFGFIPIKAGKGMKNKAIASNKLGEYLLMGVVPLISWGDSLPVISSDYYISIADNSDYVTIIKQELRSGEIAQKIIKDFSNQTWEKYATRYGDIYKEVFSHDVR